MTSALLAWEHPIPVSVEDANAIVSRLQSDETVAHRPGVDALMRRLWQLYPHDIKGHVDDMVWEDVFLHEPEPRHALQAFWPTRSRALEVLPRLIVEANQSGFIVFDPDLDTVYLPSGRVLRASDVASKWRARAPDELEPRAAEAELMRLLATGLGRLGFQQESLGAWRKVFVRRFDGGRQVISPSIRANLDEILFDCGFEAFLDAADKILPPTPVSDPSGNAVVGFFLIGFMEQNMLVRLSRTETSHRMLSGRGQAGIVRLAETSLQLIEHNLLPVLDRCRSFEAYGVDVAARLEEEPYVPLGERTILRIAAVAAGAPDKFEMVASNDLAWLDAAVQDAKERFAGRPQTIARAAEVYDDAAQFIQATRIRLSAKP